MKHLIGPQQPDDSSPAASPTAELRKQPFDPNIAATPPPAGQGPVTPQTPQRGYEQGPVAPQRPQQGQERRELRWVRIKPEEPKNRR
jgi:hypothetical protein